MIYNVANSPSLVSRLLTVQLQENGSFEGAQKQEMRIALDATMEKSMHQSMAAPVPV